MSRVKSVVIACLALLALSGCNKYGGASRYCEREQRVIPDAELKARLLLNMRKSKSSWVKLPDYMNAYLAKELPSNATDHQIQAVLSEFAAKNPLCCQFTRDFDLFEDYWSGGREGPHMANYEYFANIYIIDEFENFTDLRNLSKSAKLKVGLRPYGAASNCGHFSAFIPG